MKSSQAEVQYWITVLPVACGMISANETPTLPNYMFLFETSNFERRTSSVVKLSSRLLVSFFVFLREGRKGGSLKKGLFILRGGERLFL